MRVSRYATALAPAFAVALLAAPLIATPARDAAAQIGVGVSITVAPPVLPVYVQPPMPDDGYLWTPGYWAYGLLGYYWVPGTWVLPPEPGLLWTPGYWGWNSGVYVFNRGYWGPHVGFYGGVNYGFGYGGFGFEGGEWRGGRFAYNSAVTNFGGVHVTNVYNKTVIVDRNVTRVSFNGPGGVAVRPRPEEEAFAHERHIDPTPLQQQHETVAAKDRTLLASVNHGRPAIAATAHPGVLHGPGVVPARVGAPIAPGLHAVPHASGAPAPHVVPHAAPTPSAPFAAHHAPAPMGGMAPMARPGMAPMPHAGMAPMPHAGMAPPAPHAAPAPHAGPAPRDDKHH